MDGATHPTRRRRVISRGRGPETLAAIGAFGGVPMSSTGTPPRPAVLPSSENSARDYIASAPDEATLELRYSEMLVVLTHPSGRGASAKTLRRLDRSVRCKRNALLIAACQTLEELRDLLARHEPPVDDFEARCFDDAFNQRANQIARIRS